MKCNTPHPAWWCIQMGAKYKAAVVCMDPQETRQMSLGADTEYTVSVGELEGIRLALSIMKDMAPTVSELVIITDNQAALKVVHHPGSSSGQYVIGRIISLASPHGAKSGRI
jgi:hypothetical protein